MTCVAWDGEQLAGDRLGIWSGMRTRCRKVFRVIAPNGRIALVGYSGTMAFVRAHLHWLAGGERPTFTGPEFRWSVMMIDDRRNVWLRGDNADYWDKMMGPGERLAIGSGADFALASMLLGKSAPDAVRIASRLDHGTGGGVDVVRFK